jgi:hypothetical protein
VYLGCYERGALRPKPLGAQARLSVNSLAAALVILIETQLTWIPAAPSRAASYHFCITD